METIKKEIIKSEDLLSRSSQDLSKAIKETKRLAKEVTDLRQKNADAVANYAHSINDWGGILVQSIDNIEQNIDEFHSGDQATEIIEKGQQVKSTYDELQNKLSVLEARFRNPKFRSALV